MTIFDLHGLILLLGHLLFEEARVRYHAWIVASSMVFQVFHFSENQKNTSYNGLTAEYALF